MAEAGLFIGWGQIVRGREAKGLGVFGDAVNFWTAEQASGAIEGFETVLLGPHGGDLAGFILVRGSNEQIAAVRGNEEFQRVNATGRCSCRRARHYRCRSWRRHRSSHDDLPGRHRRVLVAPPLPNASISSATVAAGQRTPLILPADLIGSRRVGRRRKTRSSSSGMSWAVRSSEVAIGDHRNSLHVIGLPAVGEARPCAVAPNARFERRPRLQQRPRLSAPRRSGSLGSRGRRGAERSDAAGRRRGEPLLGIHRTARRASARPGGGPYPISASVLWQPSRARRAPIPSGSMPPRTAPSGH